MVATRQPHSISYTRSDNVTRELRPRQGFSEQGSLYDADNVVADIIGGNIDTLYVTSYLDQRVSMTQGTQTH